MNYSKLKEIITEAGFDPYDFDGSGTRRKIKPCLAYRTDNVVSSVAEIISSAKPEERVEVCRAFMNSRSFESKNSEGAKIGVDVIYFPDIFVA